MFRHDKLTGARRRKWAHARAYAETIAVPAPPKVPATVASRIRKPENLKAIARVGGAGRATHYVMVVGHRLAFVDHLDIAADASLYVFSGKADYECRCHEVRGFWASWAQTGPETPGQLWTDDLDGVPAALAAVRQKCRPRAARCRVIRVYKRRATPARQWDWYAVDDAEHPTPARPDDRNMYRRYEDAGHRVRAQRAAQQSLSAALTAAAGLPVVVKFEDVYGHELCVHKLRRPTGGNDVVTVDADPFTWLVRVKNNPRADPPGMVRVSEFSIGPVTVCCGLRAADAAALELRSVDNQHACHQYVRPVYWTPDGTVVDLPPDGLDCLAALEGACRVDRKLKIIKRPGG